MSKKLKILCVGPQWRGSNAGGLFHALSRIGHIIEIADENYYLNLHNQLFKNKIIDKIFRGSHIREFNTQILSKADLLNPDVVLIYKGAFILPETITLLKQKNIFVCNFYPDVSFHTHGTHLSKSLPLYDHIFTTKLFGIKDMKDQLGINNSSFIPHGFDPEIHRKIDIADLDVADFNCDISFIGGFSKKKEYLLSEIREKLPTANIKIWGPGWGNSKMSCLKTCIQNKSITGDLYSIGIICSKINMGIVHEQVFGSSSGDKITSRTFHIPAAGGFLLHERNDEVLTYFEEDKEAVFFEGTHELVQKIDYFLTHENERKKIQVAGYERAHKNHSLDKRAEQLINFLKEKKTNGL